MSTTRIKDISATAVTAASDDYLALDGATNGTRKIKASDIGGGGGTTLVIDVDGTDYPVTGLAQMTVSGVTGVYLYYNDGNDGAIFFPDGVAMNNVKQTIEAEIPTAVSELTNDSGYLTLATLPIYSGGVS